ncbi:hypothetical protein, partial [Endozoicomonas sp. ALB091]|uniref:hypothetical protein n=1 Tax=Endozoicomonas sp. ALB091 TaxID=3403073 RepID=UPI003BB6E38C
SGEATVSYDIAPVNDNAPKAENDRYRLEEGGELSGRNIIRDNDADIDLIPDTLTIASVNGTVWADLVDSDDCSFHRCSGLQKSCHGQRGCVHQGRRHHPVPSRWQ